MVKLYDTLTRSMKPLQARDGKTYRFYCCGPTVYGPAHIGNFRTFTLQDVLRRVVEVAGMKPYYVRNITDVDDKTIRRSQQEGLNLVEFTTRWTKQFQEDCLNLNNLAPDVEPRATRHIGEQIGMIKKLVDKGHAYAASDGSVYFKVESFEKYGKLSRLDTREIATQSVNSAGEVNDADEYDRESVRDFALWKAHKPEDGDNFWNSPWGKGRPGWHIECSAMSRKYLGDDFDLHGGGIDLCFPHHENEIAQSEAATGKPFAHHWFHCTHLMVDKGKMAKSSGKMYTLGDIVKKGYHPMHLRYFLISGHYRQPLNFKMETLDSLKAARSAMNKLNKSVTALLKKSELNKAAFNNLMQAPFPADDAWGLFTDAWQALEDDLNTPSALGALFSGLKSLGSATMDQQALTGQMKALAAILYALGLDVFAGQEEAVFEVPVEIASMAESRWQAKQARNWPEADRLRQCLAEKGWKVLDRKEGYEVVPLDR